MIDHDDFTQLVQSIGIQGIALNNAVLLYGTLTHYLILIIVPQHQMAFDLLLAVRPSYLIVDVDWNLYLLRLVDQLLWIKMHVALSLE